MLLTAASTNVNKVGQVLERLCEEVGWGSLVAHMPSCGVGHVTDTQAALGGGRPSLCKVSTTRAQVCETWECVRCLVKSGILWEDAAEDGRGR